MEEILTDLSASKIVSAIEENLVLFVHQLNDNPQAEFHDDPDLLWSISDIPVPVFNPVLRASLAPENVDVAIMTVIARAQARNVPVLWRIGPATQPPDLGSYLQARGFVHKSRIPRDGNGVAVPE